GSVGFQGWEVRAGGGRTKRPKVGTAWDHVGTGLVLDPTSTRVGAELAPVFLARRGGSAGRRSHRRNERITLRRRRARPSRLARARLAWRPLHRGRRTAPDPCADAGRALSCRRRKRHGRELG